MSTVEPLYGLMANGFNKYSKSERILLEAGLFSCVCNQLKELFKEQYSEYFRVMKFTIEMENAMIDTNFVCLVIKDILSTNEYNLEGIAYYTNVHEDIIYDIVTGQNKNPSAMVLQKVIDLHRSVRPNLYREIIKKIAND